MVTHMFDAYHNSIISRYKQIIFFQMSNSTPVVTATTTTTAASSSALPPVNPSTTTTLKPDTTSTANVTLIPALVSNVTEIQPIFLQTSVAQGIAGTFAFAALLITCHQVSLLKEKKTQLNFTVNKKD